MGVDWRAGETRRWVMWGVLVLGFFLMSFNRVTTGVLAEDLTRAFGLTATELSVLHSSFFYVYAPLQLPAGLLVDRYGPRRVSSTGIVLMSVGVCAFALSGSLATGGLSRLLVGLGGSVIYLSILRFGADWFRENEFATLVGLSIAASGLGGLAATTPLALFVAAVGWRGATLAAGVAGVALGVATYLVVRDSPAAAAVDAPRGVTAESGTAPNRQTVLANTRRVLSSLDAWLLGVVLFLTIGTNLTILGLWGVPYLVHVYGVSVPAASSVVLVGTLGLVVGSPLFGWLSDRLDARLGFMLVGTVVFTLGYAVIAVTAKPPLVVVAAVFFLGNFVTGATALSYTLVKERHPDASGAATGALNSLGYFGAAIIPAAMGVTLDVYWTGETIRGSRIYSLAGYRLAFGVAALAGVVAVVCVAVVIHRSRR